MSEPDSRMVLHYGVSPEKLYEQFATQKGIRNWWTVFCTMRETEGGETSFRFPSAGFHAKVRIVKLEAKK